MGGGGVLFWFSTVWRWGCIVGALNWGSGLRSVAMAVSCWLGGVSVVLEAAALGRATDRAGSHKIS
jgi:hypothetical protein